MGAMEQYPQIGSKAFGQESVLSEWPLEMERDNLKEAAMVYRSSIKQFFEAEGIEFDPRSTDVYYRYHSDTMEPDFDIDHTSSPSKEVVFLNSMAEGSSQPSSLVIVNENIIHEQHRLSVLTTTHLLSGNGEFHRRKSLWTNFDGEDQIPDLERVYGGGEFFEAEILGPALITFSRRKGLNVKMLHKSFDVSTEDDTFERYSEIHNSYIHQHGSILDGMVELRDLLQELQGMPPLLYRVG